MSVAEDLRSAVPANYPLSRYPVSLVADAGKIQVVDAGLPELDLPAVRSFWSDHAHAEPAPQLAAFFFNLCRRFVKRVVATNPAKLRELHGKPVLFLANHQAMLESFVFSVLGPVITGTPVMALAKKEQRDSLLVQTSLAACSAFAGTPDTPIVYFDRSDPSALLPIMAAFRRAIVEEGRSVMVHVEGVRGRSCRTPVQKISGSLLDLAIDTETPIVPVRFTGGLPVEPFTTRKLDFPWKFGAQEYILGAPIQPETLSALNLRERKGIVLNAINELGPKDQEVPFPGDSDFEMQVRNRAIDTIISETEAALIECAGLAKSARIVDFLAAVPMAPCGRLSRPMREPQPSSTPRHVVIAGGGIAGLTAATLLAEAGLRVTLCEAAAEAGGKAKSLRRADGHPSEHSLRIYSDHYQTLLTLLSRIPNGEGQTILDNLVRIGSVRVTSQGFIGQPHPPSPLIRKPRKGPLGQAVAAIRGAIGQLRKIVVRSLMLLVGLRRRGVGRSEILRYLYAHLRLLWMCEERVRAELCDISYGKYLRFDRISPQAESFLLRNTAYPRRCAPGGRGGRDPTHGPQSPVSFHHLAVRPGERQPDHRDDDERTDQRTAHRPVAQVPARAWRRHSVQHPHRRSGLHRRASLIPDHRRRRTARLRLRCSRPALPCVAPARRPEPDPETSPASCGISLHRDGIFQRNAMLSARSACAVSAAIDSGGGRILPRVSGACSP